MSSQLRIAETAMGFWKEFSRMSREGVVYPGRGILYPVLRIAGDPSIYTQAPDAKLWRSENGGLTIVLASKHEVAEIDRAVDDDLVEVFLRTRWGGSGDNTASRFLCYLHYPKARGWE